MRRIKLFIKGLWYKFKNSQFVAHMSFLWNWKNFFLCLRYPFWKSRYVSTNKFIGYTYTWYDDIPVGWRKAFGKQLSAEIKKAGRLSRKRLGYKSWKELISWQQIKEKYGSLRLYAKTTEEIAHVLERYELISLGYCINCGKPARYVTKSSNEYLCKDCFVVGMRNVMDEEKEKILSERRLTKNNVPVLSSYTTNKQGKTIKHKVNIKRIYDVDFGKLWGLEK